MDTEIEIDETPYEERGIINQLAAWDDKSSQNSDFSQEELEGEEIEAKPTFVRRLSGLLKKQGQELKE